MAVKIEMEMPKCCCGCILCNVHNGGESASCKLLGVSLTVREFHKEKPIACPLKECK